MGYNLETRITAAEELVDACVEDFAAFTSAIEPKIALYDKLLNSDALNSLLEAGCNRFSQSRCVHYI